MSKKKQDPRGSLDYQRGQGAGYTAGYLEGQQDARQDIRSALLLALGVRVRDDQVIEVDRQETK
jgi:hypothetical protein